MPNLMSLALRAVLEDNDLRVFIGTIGVFHTTLVYRLCAHLPIPMPSTSPLQNPLVDFPKNQCCSFGKKRCAVSHVAALSSSREHFLTPAANSAISLT